MRERNGKGGGGRRDLSVNFGLSLFISASMGLLKRGITEVYKTVLICWDLAVLRVLPTLTLFTSGECTAIDLGLI